MTLRNVVSDAMLEGDEVLIDLSQVSFIDAVGLSAIVDCLRQARSIGGTVRLCNLRPQVRRRIGLVTVRRPSIAGLAANGHDSA
jgi:anti-anti-sigma factor